MQEPLKQPLIIIIININILPLNKINSLFEKNLKTCIIRFKKIKLRVESSVNL